MEEGRRAESSVAVPPTQEQGNKGRLVLGPPVVLGSAGGILDGDDNLGQRKALELLVKAGVCQGGFVHTTRNKGATVIHAEEALGFTGFPLVPDLKS